MKGRTAYEPDRLKMHINLNREMFVDNVRVSGHNLCIICIFLNLPIILTIILDNKSGNICMIG